MRYNKRTYEHLAKTGSSVRRAPSSHGQAGTANPRSVQKKRSANATEIPKFVENRSPARENSRREKMIQDSVNRRRRKHKKNYILYYISLFVILLVVGVSLSLTVFFNIEEITVEGNGAIPASQIIAIADVKKGDNLFRTNTKRAENAIISQYKTLDKVTVSRNLPSALSIKVEQAEVMAVIHDGDKYYTVSRGNRIVNINDKHTNGSIEVIGCDLSKPNLGSYLSTSTKNKLNILTAVVNAVKDNDMDKKIQYADLTDITTIKLYYDNRIEIKLGGITDASYEMSHVKQLIKNEVSAKEIVSIDASLHNGKYYIRPLEALTLPTDGKSSVSKLRNTVSSGATTAPSLVAETSVPSSSVSSSSEP